MQPAVCGAARPLGVQPRRERVAVASVLSVVGKWVVEQAELRHAQLGVATLPSNLSAWWGTGRAGGR